MYGFLLYAIGLATGALGHAIYVQTKRADVASATLATLTARMPTPPLPRPRTAPFRSHGQAHLDRMDVLNRLEADAQTVRRRELAIVQDAAQEASEASLTYYRDRSHGCDTGEVA